MPGNVMTAASTIQCTHGGSAKMEAGGAQVLTQSSVGQRKSSAGAVQGVAIVANTQSKVKAI